MSEELTNLLAGWKPEFGNETHIRLLADLRKLRMIEARPSQTKNTLETMKRLNASIIWMIKQTSKNV